MRKYILKWEKRDFTILKERGSIRRMVMVSLLGTTENFAALAQWGLIASENGIGFVSFLCFPCLWVVGPFRDTIRLWGSQSMPVPHKVYRVPDFLSSCPNWVPPPPYPLESVAPSPPVDPRGRHTRLRGRGWGTQFRRWDRHSGTLSCRSTVL